MGSYENLLICENLVFSVFWTFDGSFGELLNSNLLLT